jgi:hypothetical protein
VALNKAAHKPLCWFCYVDDAFVIWPHGPDRLKNSTPRKCPSERSLHHGH